MSVTNIANNILAVLRRLNWQRVSFFNHFKLEFLKAKFYIKSI